MNRNLCNDCGQFLRKGQDAHGCDPVKVCAVDGCDTDARARGWCSKHLQRFYHHGHTGLVEEPAERRDAATHGSRRMYDMGCRCLPCAVANSRYHRERREGTSRRVDVAELLPLLDDLNAVGWTNTQIERDAELANSTVWRLRNSGQEQANSRTADAIRDLHDAATSTPDRIPAEPLLTAIDRMAARVGGLKTLLDESNRRTYYRAAHRGWVDHQWADRIACHVLGQPLELLYGIDYQGAA